jgi:hypothetical protein
MEAAKPQMNAGERNYVFVTIGAGDTFTAIRSLINLAGAKRIPLHPHLVQLCAAWLRGYAFHDEHEKSPWCNRRCLEAEHHPGISGNQTSANAETPSAAHSEEQIGYENFRSC